MAIATYSEPDAEHVIAECENLSLDVPGMVAVISIGNDPLLCENRETTISAIDTNLSLGGYEAARLLDSLIRSPRKWRQRLNTITRIPPRAVISRKSTDTLTHPDAHIRDILIYIHDHLGMPFGAAEVASAFGIPRTTLDRKFQKAVGHSIGSEISSQRLAHVKQLLVNSDLPLKTIAADCGFCNQAFLTTTFRKSTGKVPSLWRREQSIARIHHADTSKTPSGNSIAPLGTSTIRM